MGNIQSCYHEQDQYQQFLQQKQEMKVEQYVKFLKQEQKQFAKTNNQTFISIFNNSYQNPQWKQRIINYLKDIQTQWPRYYENMLLFFKNLDIEQLSGSIQRRTWLIFSKNLNTHTKLKQRQNQTCFVRFDEKIMTNSKYNKQRQKKKIKESSFIRENNSQIYFLQKDIQYTDHILHEVINIYQRQLDENLIEFNGNDKQALMDQVLYDFNIFIDLLTILLNELQQDQLSYNNQATQLSLSENDQLQLEETKEDNYIQNQMLFTQLIIKCISDKHCHLMQTIIQQIQQANTSTIQSIEFVMKKLENITLKSLDIYDTFLLENEDIPYSSAIQLLQKIATRNNPCDIINEIVKLKEEICNCVEQYYLKQQIKDINLQIDADLYTNILVYIILKSKMPKIYILLILAEKLGEKILDDCEIEAFCFIQITTAYQYIINLSKKTEDLNKICEKCKM